MKTGIRGHNTNFFLTGVPGTPYVISDFGLAECGVTARQDWHGVMAAGGLRHGTRRDNRRQVGLMVLEAHVTRRWVVCLTDGSRDEHRCCRDNTYGVSGNRLRHDDGHFAPVLACRPDGDLHVLPQGGEKVREALDGEGAGAVAQQCGNVGPLTYRGSFWPPPNASGTDRAHPTIFNNPLTSVESLLTSASGWQ